MNGRYIFSQKSNNDIYCVNASDEISAWESLSEIIAMEKNHHSPNISHTRLICDLLMFVNEELQDNIVINRKGVRSIVVTIK